MRSSVEKSGRLRPESAWTIPMVASFGRSSPLAIVWVPMMMSMSPDLTCSVLKRRRNSDSSNLVPNPL